MKTLLVIAIFIANCCALMAQPGTVDTIFNHNGKVFTSNFFYRATCMAVQPDGKVLLGGAFKLTAFPNSGAGIVRLNNDGTVDSLFINRTNGAIANRCITLQPDGKILVGGDRSPYLARFNSDGALDTTFGQRTGLDEPVNAIAVQPDGKIIIGGQFNTVSGISNYRIARLNADGDRDTTFVLPSFITGYGPRSIALQPDGKMIVGGNFDVNGTSTNIVRLNADGTIDSTFMCGSGFVLSASTLGISTLLLQPDNKAIVGGNFESYNGTSCKSIVRLNTNGTVDTSFNAGWLVTSAPDTIDVVAIMLQNDGKMIVSSNNSTALLVRMDSTGKQDSTFHIYSDGIITSMGLQPDGKIIIGGAFAHINFSLRNLIARLRGGEQIGLSLSGNTTFCAGDTSLLVAHVTGNSGPVTYNWTPPTGLSCTTCDSVYASPQTLYRNYQLTATDSTGNSNSLNFLISYNCNLIWPGDANDDDIADANDVLQIGLAYNDTGSSRSLASQQWYAQFANNWQRMTNGVNNKHSDCDGNGIVNADDTMAVTYNYGFTHNKLENTTQAASTDPVLAIMPVLDTIIAGSTLSAKILLGTSSLPVDTLYGLAWSLNLDTTIFDTTAQLYGSLSWLGTSGTNMFSFQKVMPASSNVDFVLTRNDQRNTSGYGEIGELRFQTKTSLPLGVKSVTYTLSPAIIHAITANGSNKTFNTQTSQVVIIDTSLIKTGISQPAFSSSILLQPNPNNGHFFLTINRPSQQLHIEVLNLQGQEQYAVQLKDQPSLTKEFNLDNLSKGVYWLRITTEDGVVVKRVVVQ